MLYFQPCTSDHPCGKGSHAYTILLTKGLVNVFDKVMQAYNKKGRPISNGDMDLNNVEYATWKHLRYFGLIEDMGEGAARPTNAAYDFYRGLMPIFTTVALMDDKVLPLGHEAWLTHSKKPKQQYIYEIDGEMWKQRKEFLNEFTRQSSIFALL